MTHPDDCYCARLPRDPKTGQLLARCNVCWNEICEGMEPIMAGQTLDWSLGEKPAPPCVQ